MGSGNRKRRQLPPRPTSPSIIAKARPSNIVTTLIVLGCALLNVADLIGKPKTLALDHTFA
jgi:hypothetical protein